VSLMEQTVQIRAGSNFRKMISSSALRCRRLAICTVDESVLAGTNLIFWDGGRRNFMQVLETPAWCWCYLVSWFVTGVY
jgi:hypothetical protein